MSMPKKSKFYENSTFVSGPIESSSDVEKLTNTILSQLTSQYKIQPIEPVLIMKVCDYLILSLRKVGHY